MRPETPYPQPEADSWPFPPPAPAPARLPNAGPLKPRSNRRHGLTLRQNAFCENFVATGNAAEAARRAGYSERTARAQGHRLLKDARVRTQVRALHAALADRIDPGLILGRLENLYRLAEQAGGYRAAASILALMGRFVGLDRRGMALGLLSRNRMSDPPPRQVPPRETPYRLPSAVETMKRAMGENGPE